MYNLRIGYGMLDLILNYSLSTLAGLLIGKERKKHDKAGGARTFAILCLGGCNLAMLVSSLNGTVSMDFTRLLSYGLASIGFIGSGLIIKGEHGVDGITTACCMWSIVPLGYLIGLGNYMQAFLTFIFMYVILEHKYWNIK